MVILELLSFSKGNFSYLIVWAILAQSDGPNNTFELCSTNIYCTECKYSIEMYECFGISPGNRHATSEIRVKK